MSQNLIKHVCIVGIAEGYSYLLLLGVAMPLKYFAGIPEVVRIVGSIHGFLFMLYVVVVLRAAMRLKWPWKQTMEIMIAAVIPFGTFFLERKLRPVADNPAQDTPSIPPVADDPSLVIPPSTQKFE